MAEVNSIISYGDYVGECTHPDNDFVYQLTVDDEILGSYESIQNQVPSDVLRQTTSTNFGVTNSVMYLLAFESGWDGENYPDATSFLEAKFFGFINNNYPDGTTIKVEYFENNAAYIANTPVETENWTIDTDFWLDKYTPKNDYFFTDVDLYSYGSIGYVRITVGFPSAPTFAQLGRLFVGKKFDIIVSNTNNQAFDGDWSITLETEGFSDRNLTQSSSQAVCRPQQKMLSLNKSNLNYAAAFGVLTPNFHMANMNTPSFYKMGIETANCLDIIAIPDSTSQKSMRFTGVYGTLENRLRIQKGDGAWYNVSMDILELVPELDN